MVSEAAASCVRNAFKTSCSVVLMEPQEVQPAYFYIVKSISRCQIMIRWKDFFKQIGPSSLSLPETIPVNAAAL